MPWYLENKKENTTIDIKVNPLGSSTPLPKRESIGVLELNDANKIIIQKTKPNNPPIEILTSKSFLFILSINENTSASDVAITKTEDLSAFKETPESGTEKHIKNIGNKKVSQKEALCVQVEMVLSDVSIAAIIPYF